MKQIERSLFPTAKDMFRPILQDVDGNYIGKSQIREKDKMIIFPSGAKIEFSYLDRDEDAVTNWQGKISALVV